jgi:phosphoglycolate phosphatase
MISVDLMLFDLDGTLIDSLDDLTASINLMLAEVGRPPLDRSTVGSFIGDGVRVLVYRSLTATDPKRRPPDERLHAEAINLMHKNYADRMLDTTRLYAGVIETLDHFRDKRKAVVTSKEARFTRLILDHFGINEHFQAVVGGDTVPARKPDPWPVREAITELGGEASRAVMIGDSENDVNAGRNAGARTCAVTFGYRSHEELALARPDIIVDSFEQLKQYFS